MEYYRRTPIRRHPCCGKPWKWRIVHDGYSRTLLSNELHDRDTCAKIQAARALASAQREASKREAAAIIEAAKIQAEAILAAARIKVDLPRGES